MTDQIVKASNLSNWDDSARMDSVANAKMKQDFVSWQCRIRADAMRRLAGRPTSGMRPCVQLRDGTVVMQAMTALLVPAEPQNDTAFFRFQVQKTIDPKKTYDAGLKYLQSGYFQQPGNFNGVLTAQFAEDSTAAATLATAGRCVLSFAQHQENWKLLCSVRRLEKDDPACEHTVWHNRMFNPTVSGSVSVLQFAPDWKSANAGVAV